MPPPVDDDYEDDRPRRRRPREDDGDYDDDGYVRRRPPKDLGDDPAMRLVLPVGTSGWAIASGYLGLVSVLCLPGPFAILTGILALRQMKKNPKVHGKGRAWFGIVMGGLACAFLVGSLIFGAIGGFK